MIKIAIQGQNGSFHAQAAAHYFDNQAIKIINCRLFADVFKSLSEPEVDYAVVAIENSLYGSINEVYDLLIKHDFVICGEIFLRIKLHLLGLAGANLQDIREVYSQIPALDQSKNYLAKNLPVAEIIEFYDTAASAEFVSTNNDSSRAAVAGSAAAKEYGLIKVASGIEDNQQNFTRFIVLQKPNQAKTNHTRTNKTSITFSTANKPGTLYEVLGVFAKANINLTKLESRPLIGKAWRYIYYLDFEARVGSHSARQALAEVKMLSKDLRVLGIYKCGKIARET